MLSTRVLLLIIFSICLQSYAQNNLSDIVSSSIDKSFLEFLLKKEIDEVRIDHGLSPLINDSILFIAAADHSNYLSKVRDNDFSHFQKRNKSKHAPQDRAEYYGASGYLVGENILYYTIDKGTDTYQSIAEKMRQMWVNSPGHYANIITPNYKLTGISIKHDKLKNRLYAVQKFAFVNQFYEPKNSDKLFPFEKFDKRLADTLFVENNIKEGKHKKHAWGVRLNNGKKRCCDSDYLDAFHYESIETAYLKDTLYLIIKRPYVSQIKKFFQHKKDGVLLEFLDFEYTYSCVPEDNFRLPTRQNHHCVFNGVTTKPVYRDSVLFYIEKYANKRNATIKVPLGKLPKSVMGKKIDVNLLVLQKNRLCKVIQGQGLCGSLIEPRFPQFDMSLSFDQLRYRPKVKPIRHEFKVWFKKDQVSILNPDTLDQIKNILAARNQFVSKIILNAYASVEGSIERNTNLFNQRAQNILETFQRKQDSTIKLVVNTKENWNLFRKQLKGSEHAFLLELDSTRLKQYVNQRKHSNALEYLLAKQRYGQVIIYTKPIIDQNNMIDFACKELKRRDAYMFVNKSKQWKKAYLYLLRKTYKEEISWNVFDSCTIPFSEKIYDDINYKRLMVEIIKNKETPKDSAYEKLKYYAKSLKTSEAKYNELAYLINNHHYLYNTVLSSKSIKDFMLLSKKQGIDSAKQEQLKLSYHIKLSNEAANSGKAIGRIKSSLDYIYNYYITDQKLPSEEFRYRLAKYFITFKQYERSISILEPLIAIPEKQQAAYMLYLKLYDQLQMAGKRNNSELLLIESIDKLSKKEWCSLFSGSCKIRFQIFEHQTLKNLYCEHCLD